MRSMSELPKAQVGKISEFFSQEIIITIIVCSAVVASFGQMRACYVGEDVARAKCITAGGDSYKCCKAFTHGGTSCESEKTEKE